MDPKAEPRLRPLLPPTDAPEKPSPYDKLLVVPAGVWEDFVALRLKWDNHCVNGFVWDCERNERAAVREKDLAGALHWRAVNRLSAEYCDAVCCAIEVDGVIFREVPLPTYTYPPDENLHRVQVGVVPE